VESHHSAEPRSVKETLSGPNAREWIDTMKDEKESMRTNQDWDLVILPVDTKLMGINGFSRSSEKQMDLLTTYSGALNVGHQI